MTGDLHHDRISSRAASLTGKSLIQKLDQPTGPDGEELPAKTSENIGSGKYQFEAPNREMDRMLQPDGTAYFYFNLPPVTTCNHSFLYVVWKWNEQVPAFCGLCFMAALFRDELPTRIHEYMVLAENGNPEMKPGFVNYLQRSLGLVAPLEDQGLKEFRLARGQYIRKPSKASSPATFALWQLFGYQPKMAKPLFRLILGETEDSVSRELGLSTYSLQTLVAKGIRTALRYAR